MVKAIQLINLLNTVNLVDWSVGRRLPRNQHQPKAPQERSDEEIEVMPAERVRLERKSMIHIKTSTRTMNYLSTYLFITVPPSLTYREWNRSDENDEFTTRND